MYVQYVEYVAGRRCETSLHPYRMCCYVLYVLRTVRGKARTLFSILTSWNEGSRFVIGQLFLLYVCMYVCMYVLVLVIE